jgi:hypothetical protein
MHPCQKLLTKMAICSITDGKIEWKSQTGTYIGMQRTLGPGTVKLARKNMCQSSGITDGSYAKEQPGACPLVGRDIQMRGTKQSTIKNVSVPSSPPRLLDAVLLDRRSLVTLQASGAGQTWNGGYGLFGNSLADRSKHRVPWV